MWSKPCAGDDAGAVAVAREGHGVGPGGAVGATDAVVAHGPGDRRAAVPDCAVGAHGEPDEAQVGVRDRHQVERTPAAAPTLSVSAPFSNTTPLGVGDARTRVKRPVAAGGANIVSLRL